MSKKLAKNFNNTIVLFNEIILNSQKIIKYLGIYLNKKLNFKIHVNHKIVTVKWNLHAILTLIKLKKGLNFMTTRQLFLSCICTISNYGFANNIISPKHVAFSCFK